MAKKKTKKAAPVKPLKSEEAAYKRQMNLLAIEMMKAINAEVLPILKAQQSAYVLDGISDTLEVIFRRLNSQFTGVITAGFAKTTAANMVEKVGTTNERKFNNSIIRSTGIDPGMIVSTEGLEDFVKGSINKNVSLIKSLPEEYLKQVETIVMNGVTSGARYSEIAKQITAIKGSANSKLKNRIKTIARNEVQTINAQMTVRRSESLGITKGIFRTSEDERVRKCHTELNGVEFELKKGAWSKSCGKFIKPGITDINCRCTYSPVIEV